MTMARGVARPVSLGMLVGASVRVWAPAALAVAGASAVRADVEYRVDDGGAELAVGIDPGETTIWMNRFPVRDGGEVITSVAAAYGRPGSASQVDGLQVSIMLYEVDPACDPRDATLKRRIDAVTANGNTRTINTYAVPPTPIRGDLIVCVIYRNTTDTNRYISALDLTPPIVPGASYAGFAVEGIDPANLRAIPPDQFWPVAEKLKPGMFILRATGRPRGPVEDVNCDGVVNAADVAAVIGAWGACAGPADCPSDVDGDGVVDASDVALVLGAWGAS